MKTLSMYGYSDDNIVFDGIAGADEFGRFGDNPYRAGFLVRSESANQSLVIHCIYYGHWCFAIGVGEESDYEVPPPWEIKRKWGGECEYSETVEIIVPDDAVLSEIKQ